MENTLLEIQMKIAMKILYIISMKTIQVNIPPQNLQLQHRMHHNCTQPPINLLEFQLGRSPRPNTYDPQSHLDTSARRNKTFIFPSNSDEEIQEETQNIISIRSTSVNVSSPTRTALNTTQNITQSIYDPPPLPSIFRYPNKTIQSEDNNIQQTSSRYYDPFSYSFYPDSNTNTQTNSNQNISQDNSNPNLRAQYTYTHPLPTNAAQTSFPPQS